MLGDGDELVGIHISVGKVVTSKHVFSFDDIERRSELLLATAPFERALLIIVIVVRHSKQLNELK